MASPITYIESLFRVARFWNLMIIALAQYFTVAFLVHPYLVLDWAMFGLSTSTVLIAAAGYIINDYYDVKIDLINKPERVVVGKSISRRYAILLHSLLSIAGVLLGLLLNWKIGVINFFCAVLLWWYSNFLKRLPLVGNIAVGVLTGLSILVVNILYGGENSITILIYSIFAFFTTVVREIIKDMEDLKGDNTYGCKTLPIVIGIRKTKYVIYGLTLAFIALIFVIHFLVEPLPMKYFTVFLFTPVAWMLLQLNSADTKRDFNKLSTMCKVVMLLGIFSMAVGQMAGDFQYGVD